MCSLTNINVLEKGPVHGGADEVRDILAEDDVAAVVAVVEGRQNVRRVVRHAVSVGLDIAHLVARRWDRDRQTRLLGVCRDLWAGRDVAGRLARAGCDDSRQCREDSKELHAGV